MALYDRDLTLPNFFFQPLADCYPVSDSQYLCHELSDLDYLKLGVERCISSARSGNGFLQTYRKEDGSRVSVSHFFESLKSKRRLSEFLRQIFTKFLRQAYFSLILLNPCICHGFMVMEGGVSWRRKALWVGLSASSCGCSGVLQTITRISLRGL